MACIYIRKRARYFSLILLIIALLSFSFPVPVKAQGIAISGTFYRQHFRLVPGETVATPDIYVVVFNRDEDEVKIRLTSHVSPAVEAEVILSETDFTIPTGGKQKVEVGIRVGPEAVPDDYSISITAHVVKEGTGIVVTGAAQQQAKLSIFGEAGDARINTVTYDGEPFSSEIHLFHMIEGQLMPSGYSSTGDLSIRLVPGDYRIQVLYHGTELVIEEFSIQADETQEITLIARPVFIIGFSAVPNFYTDTGEIAFAKLTYTIKNIYKPEKSVQVILNVTHDGELIEEAEIFSLPTLDLEGLAGSYQYIPFQRWQEGYYVFQTQLRSQVTDVLIAESRKVGLRLIEMEAGLMVALHNEFNLYPQGGELASTDGFIMILAPEGAVSEAALVIIESAVDVPSPPKGFSLGSMAATIEATSESGQSAVGLQKPVRICLAYTDDELGKSGGDVARLYVGYYDTETGTWHILESEAEPENDRVCASTDHWSIWSVLIKHKGLPIWITLVAILGGVVCASILVLLAMRYHLIARVKRTARRYRWFHRIAGRMPLKRIKSSIQKTWGSCRGRFHQMRGQMQVWLRHLLRRPPPEE